MLLKELVIILLLLLSGSSQPVLAQLITLGHIKQRLEILDSLIAYNQNEEAKQYAHNLFQDLARQTKSKQYEEVALGIRLRQAIMLDNEFEHKEALELLFDLAGQSAAYPEIACLVFIKISFIEEKVNNYELADQYLNKALAICLENKLEALYSTILIRRSLLYRFEGKLDSSLFYAHQTIIFAQKHHNYFDEAEANNTIGILYGKNKLNNVKKSIDYYKIAIRHFMATNNANYAGAVYLNLARTYIVEKNLPVALAYTDSALLLYNDMHMYYKLYVPKCRSDIYEMMGHIDSAYYYFKHYYDDYLRKVAKQEETGMKRLAAEYEDGKKEAVIKSKNQVIVFTVFIALLIGGATMALLLQNKKIKKQNKLIQQQVAELQKLLDQQKILLSELQHRVKNNLQQVISILDIQKDSIHFNNVEELVRENQNRIHSMALLYKKLSATENINDVSMSGYVQELSGLVIDSYNNYHKKITVRTHCTLDMVDITYALPIGLIIVELVSNSIKHAFSGQEEGLITISLTNDKLFQKNVFYYADNGNGFDFKLKTTKGLGLEIIKGLINQLNGEIKTTNNKHFELFIYF